MRNTPLSGKTGVCTSFAKILKKISTAIEYFIFI